mmetsp:Transcript_24826/g.33238  ORF Transcript_24826/g.33238 Transcript_24826/m.33238 type:complete len:178 (-) Transcript_24826:352-885(-)
MLAVLLVQLGAHQLHLLLALLLQLLILRLQLVRLFPNQLVFLLRLLDVARHLRLDRLQVLIEVLANLLSLLRFFVRNSGVPFLKLFVLSLILSRDLLVLLADKFSLGSSVLVLQSLLIENLLVHLRIDARRVYLAQQGHHLVIEQTVQTFCALLHRQVLGLACAALYVAHLRCKSAE